MPPFNLFRRNKPEPRSIQVVTLSSNHRLPPKLAEKLAAHYNLELIDLAAESGGRPLGDEELMKADARAIERARATVPAGKRGYLVAGRGTHLFNRPEVLQKLGIKAQLEILAKVFLESHSFAERARLAKEKGVRDENELTKLGAEVFQKDKAMAERYHALYGISPDELRALEGVIKIRAYDGSGNYSVPKETAALMKDVRQKLDALLR